MTKDPTFSGSDGGESWRYWTVTTFVTVGAALGLALGFLEAGLLRYVPRVTGLTQPDVTNAIWIIAPLADAPVGALAGLLLGGMAVLTRRPRPLQQALSAAAGVGLAAAYLGWLFFWFRIGRGAIIPGPLPALSPAANLLLTPVLYFLLVTPASAWLFRRAGKRTPVLRPRLGLRRVVAIVNVTIVAGLVLALLVVQRRGPMDFSSRTVAPRESGEHANVVIVMLDTVRADHLSSYGYDRPTTPNLDRLARQGALFEDAEAPASWTLPSLASVLTGLLPHQHAADWSRPMSPQPQTLAEILKARGYETAAFNANPDYGLAGWGLDQGFDIYDDAHNWLRHNLAVTFAGQSLDQALFREFVGFNEFDHLNAGQVNQRVLDWLRHRPSQQPYFLFINYMDAHRPYVPPAPYDRRFGRIPKPLLWKISFHLRDGRWSRPISAAERQQLIDGYDNSLNYLDTQVGLLLDALRTSSDARRTFVIVAGDHGESFGEHGTYDHGWDLHREVLHVPLLIAGPGIPAGRRISGVAELRELFPTALEFALGKASPQVEQASLSRFWEPGVPAPGGPPAVSELDRWTRNWRQQAELSLRDARWHYIADSRGHAELFDLQTDPTEAHNLAAAPAYQDVAQQLRAELEDTLARSALPWQNTTYLSVLDQPGKPFVPRAAADPAAFRLIGWPVGSSQAYFAEQAPAPAVRPTPSQEDLLRSLPYH